MKNEYTERYELESNEKTRYIEKSSGRSLTLHSIVPRRLRYVAKYDDNGEEIEIKLSSLIPGYINNLFERINDNSTE